MQSAECGIEKELNRARNTAYRLLTYRARSRKELEEKLKDREFGDAVIEVVVAGLTRLGYVNDREFARQWAAGRIRLRGFGKRRIEQELRNKGISRDVIQETLREVFEGAPEVDIAQQEAEKKLRSLTRFPHEVRRRRIAGHLERRGFSTETIYDVLRRVGTR
ncbi:MAG TPA: regulatory protein RecX [Nitrospirota bacterium]|nr:regulatory protein RecX [Nitrospirota bacterium]